jgi:hypothetical protein
VSEEGNKITLREHEKRGNIRITKCNKFKINDSVKRGIISEEEGKRITSKYARKERKANLVIAPNRHGSTEVLQKLVNVPCETVIIVNENDATHDRRTRKELTLLWVKAKFKAK